jgi:glutamate racemase
LGEVKAEFLHERDHQLVVVQRPRGRSRIPAAADVQNVAGDGITLVDSAQSMAERTAALLAARGLANSPRAAPRYEFHVTDVPLRFQTIGERFLGRTLTNVHVVKLD